MTTSQVNGSIEIRISNLDLTGVVSNGNYATGVLGDGAGAIELSVVNGSIDVVGVD